MKSVINFFLSIIVGYVLTLALVLVFYFFMVDYIWLPPNASRHLMKPSVYLIDEAQYTLSLGLQQYQSRLGGAEWGPLMAASVIIIVPIIILFIFTQKSFVKGIQMGGVKE